MRDQALFKIISRADVERPVGTLEYIDVVFHEPIVLLNSNRGLCGDSSLMKGQKWGLSCCAVKEKDIRTFLNRSWTIRSYL